MLSKWACRMQEQTPVIRAICLLHVIILWLSHAQVRASMVNDVPMLCTLRTTIDKLKART